MNQVRYDLAEHRHRFAVWAAARASQRGFTTVGTLRRALEATDIRTVLASPETLQFSAIQFDAQHRKWCSEICARLKDDLKTDVSFGRAAKLVAVYLKATVIMSEACVSSLGRNLHPPIDRILLKSLSKSRLGLAGHGEAWGSINWTQLEERDYYKLIGELREAMRDAPFWMIEEYWEPSESVDD